MGKSYFRKLIDLFIDAILLVSNASLNEVGPRSSYVGKTQRELHKFLYLPPSISRKCIVNRKIRNFDRVRQACWLFPSDLQVGYMLH